MVLSISLGLLSSSTTTGAQENVYLPKSNGDKERKHMKHTNYEFVGTSSKASKISILGW